MSCACGSDKKTTLVYACSGAANTGLLADQIARKMNKDGSALACGAKIFDKLGLKYQQIVLTSYGVKKGETAITPELIDHITAKVVEESICR